MTRPSLDALVGALLSTSLRYSHGFMSRASYKAHMRSLWCQVEDAGYAEHPAVAMWKEVGCGTMTARRAAAPEPAAE